MLWIVVALLLVVVGILLSLPWWAFVISALVAVIVALLVAIERESRWPGW